jgi:hypothetical protein
MNLNLKLSLNSGKIYKKFVDGDTHVHTDSMMAVA